MSVSTLSGPRRYSGNGKPEEDLENSSDELNASDEVLARRVQNGDANAFELLLRRYVRAIHAVAAAYLSESADLEDAAQETFLRTVRGIETYDPSRPFAAWLYQIARNVARNQIAARGRWRRRSFL